MATVTTIATQESVRHDVAAALETRAASAAASAAFQVSSFRDVSAAAYKADVLVQLKANISQLEDLHGRLQFMMGELSYLLRKG